MQDTLARVPINHFGRELQKEKEKGNRPGEAPADTHSLSGLTGRRERSTEVSNIGSVNMNTNDVFIEWECSANHS